MVPFFLKFSRRGVRLLNISVELQYLIFEKLNKVENEKKS